MLRDFFANVLQGIASNFEFLDCFDISLEVLKSLIELILIWIRFAILVHPSHELWHLGDVLLSPLQETISIVLERPSVDVVRAEGAKRASDSGS